MSKFFSKDSQRLIFKKTSPNVFLLYYRFGGSLFYVEFFDNKTIQIFCKSLGYKFGGLGKLMQPEYPKKSVAKIYYSYFRIIQCNESHPALDNCYPKEK